MCSAAVFFEQITSRVFLTLTFNVVCLYLKASEFQFAAIPKTLNINRKLLNNFIFYFFQLSSQFDFAFCFLLFCNGFRFVCWGESVATVKLVAIIRYYEFYLATSGLQQITYIARNDKFILIKPYVFMFHYPHVGLQPRMRIKISSELHNCS